MNKNHLRNVLGGGATADLTLQNGEAKRIDSQNQDVRFSVKAHNTKLAKNTSARQKSREISKQSRVFKPLIASSLALALGASVAVAEPTIVAGQAGSEDATNVNLSGLAWGNPETSGFYNPQASGVAIENLNFTFTSNTTTTGGSISASGSATEATYNTTITVPYGGTTNHSFKITSTQGLQMGATGEGTMKIDFGMLQKTPRSFTLDLSGITSGDFALKGNLIIEGGKADNKAFYNPDSSFTGIFGKSIQGNLTLTHSKADTSAASNVKNHRNTITFNAGASLNGNLTLEGGTNTITFKDGTITGDILKNSVNGTHKIIFEGNAIIGSYTGNGSSGTTIFDFRRDAGFTRGINNGGDNNQSILLINYNLKNDDIKNPPVANKIAANSLTLGTIAFPNETEKQISLRNNDSKIYINTKQLTMEGGFELVGTTETTINLVGNNISSIKSARFGGNAAKVTITGNNATLQIREDLYSISGKTATPTTDRFTKLNLSSLQIGGSIDTTAHNTNDITVNTLQVAKGIRSLWMSNQEGGYNKITINGTSKSASRSYIGDKDGFSVFADSSGSNTIAASNTKLTLSGGVQARNGVETKNIFNFTNSDVVIMGSITIDRGTRNANEFALNDNSTLTLNGAKNVITKLAVTGTGNSLTLMPTATNNTIESLTLGAAAGTDANGQQTLAKNGELTIRSANKLTISNFLETPQTNALRLDVTDTSLLEIRNLQENKLALNLNSSDAIINKNRGTGVRINLESLGLGGESAVTFNKNTEIGTLTLTQRSNSVITLVGGNINQGTAINEGITINTLDDSSKANLTFVTRVNTQATNKDGAVNQININTLRAGEARTYEVETLVDGNENFEVESGVLLVGETDANITLVGKTHLAGFEVTGAKIEGVLDNTTGKMKHYLTSVKAQHIDPRITNAATELASTFTNIYLANFNSLNKRMGELRDSKYAQGAWGRIFNGQESNDFSNSSTNFTTIQAGYDYAFGLGEGVTNYLGAALSYGFGFSDFRNKHRDFSMNDASNAKMTSHLVEFAIYNSYVQDEGWFNDTIIKFGSLMNSFDSSKSSNAFAFTLSDEFGYRFVLGENKEWYIDPQAEVGFGYVNSTEFTQTRTGMDLIGKADSVAVFRTRVGASFGYDFKKFTSRENGLSAKLYLGLFGEADYINGGNIEFRSRNLPATTKSQIKSDARAVLNLGTNLEIKESIKVYADFESSFGGQISTDYKINAGVRYSFGEKTQFLDVKAQEKKDEAKKKEETPIKLKEEEKKNTQEQAKDVKKETKAQEKQTTSETSKNEKVEAKKAESKKADAKAGKKQTKKQVTKKGTAKKQVKKAEANKAKSANKTAQTEGRKGGDWGWW